MLIYLSAHLGQFVLELLDGGLRPDNLRCTTLLVAGVQIIQILLLLLQHHSEGPHLLDFHLPLFGELKSNGTTVIKRDVGCVGEALSLMWCFHLHQRGPGR